MGFVFILKLKIIISFISLTVLFMYIFLNFKYTLSTFTDIFIVYYLNNLITLLNKFHIHEIVKTIRVRYILLFDINIYFSLYFSFITFITFIISPKLYNFCWPFVCTSYQLWNIVGVTYDVLKNYLNVYKSCMWHNLSYLCA